MQGKHSCVAADETVVTPGTREVTHIRRQAPPSRWRTVTYAFRVPGTSGPYYWDGSASPTPNIKVGVNIEPLPVPLLLRPDQRVWMDPNEIYYIARAQEPERDPERVMLDIPP